MLMVLIKMVLVISTVLGHTEIVELLLQHDAIDVFIKTDNGNTPLNFAVKKGRNEIVDMLIHHPQFDPCTMFIPSR